MKHVLCSAFLCIYLLDYQYVSCDYVNTTNRSRSRRQIGVTCELPSHPKNGRWTLLESDARPGDRVKKDNVLKFECDPGYKLSSSQFVVCDEKYSLFNIPFCEQKCPPKYSTPTTNVTCQNKYGGEVKCDAAVDGTFAAYSCIPYYETPVGFKKTILCVDGTWNFPNPICQPVCGKKIEKDTVKLIYRGNVTHRMEYPWIVALYQRIKQNFTNVCGGSLLSQKVIITAGHCVTNDFGNPLNSDDFIVGAGKYYLDYHDPRDKQAQYKEIARILVKPGYKGAPQRFLGDLALLITKELVTFSDVVQPVCYLDLPSIHLQAGKIGVVAGWGTTESGEQPDELRTLEIPYKYETTCAQELPSDWADKFYLVDKICAGFLNQSMSVCTGDSGSGFYFQNPEDNRYYIHGVVSIAPAEKGQCNPQQNSLYTKVAHYYDFVDRETTRQYVEQCALPLYPKNGKWTVKNQNKKPGDIVPSNTVLKVECNPGYALSSASAIINCESAIAMPNCELLCPKFDFPEGTSLLCSDKKGDEIDCSRAVEGNSLAYTCPIGYSGSKTIFCKGGSWGTVKPKCVQREKVNDPTKRHVVCTYGSWSAYEGIYPEAFNASLCTHMIYAFMGIWEKGDVRVQNDPLDLDTNKTGTVQKSIGLYRRFTNLKEKNKDLKVLLGIGGTATVNASVFSVMAGNDGKRWAFLYSLMYFVEYYNFDGVDIDWDYPKIEDRTIFKNLLRFLREKFDEKGWLLTITIRSDFDNTGYDAREMAELVDWVHLKSYYFFGPWSANTGHHSALYASSLDNTWERNHLNLDAVARNWVNFGMPKSKIVLGIAFFGMSLSLRDKNRHGVHDPIMGVGLGKEGYLKYSEICKLTDWTGVWDDEQKVPYAYNGYKWVGYETKDSIWIKAAYAKDNGFLGVHIYLIESDDVYGKCGPKQILLKHVHGGLGNPVDFDD